MGQSVREILERNNLKKGIDLNIKEGILNLKFDGDFILDSIIENKEKSFVFKSNNASIIIFPENLNVTLSYTVMYDSLLLYESGYDSEGKLLYEI